VRYSIASAVADVVVAARFAAAAAAAAAAPPEHVFVAIYAASCYSSSLRLERNLVEA